MTIVKKLSFLLLIFFSFCEGSVKDRLSQIPKEDQQKLERLFRYLICNEHMGYTLWGNKPITANEFSSGFCPAHLFSPFPHSAKLKSSMSTWKKYSHLFPIKNFIFSDRMFQLETTEEWFYEVYLINKKLCDELYKKYPEIFSDGLSPEENLIRHKGNGYQKLGLLFGYGLHNTDSYIKMCELQDCISHLPMPPKKSSQSIEAIQRSNLFEFKFKTLDITDPDTPVIKNPECIDQALIVENYLKMEKQWISFSSYRSENRLNPVRLPVLKADKEHEETKRLFDDYSKTRAQLFHILKQPNFLEIVLDKLCEEL
ncbi:MAG: hypothetical protein WD595_05665 [Waddliaceae bacterium]